MSRIAELRIKIKSLAAECSLIHADEIRYKKKARKARLGEFDDAEHVRAFWSLREHRCELKQLSRAALLSFAFLRGKPYSFAEQVSKKDVPWGQIEANAKRFGGALFDEEKFDAWQEAGQETWDNAQQILKKREQVKRERAEAKQAQTPPVQQAG